MTTAVNLFLYQCVLRFSITLPGYSDKTIGAMEEAINISRDSNVKGYNSIEELKKSLMKDQNYTLKYINLFKKNYKK